MSVGAKTTQAAVLHFDVLVDAIDGLLAKLMSETKRDLGAFVRIVAQFSGVNPSN